MRTKTTPPDYELIEQAGPGRAHIRFTGRFRGNPVEWDATVLALDRYPRRGERMTQFIEIGAAGSDRVPITIGLGVAVIDAATLAKTVIMIRNYKRLQPGRHEFIVARHAAEAAVASSDEVMIFSGGQTGVDRAALDVALDLKLRCGGWCPSGRRAEDGPIHRRYPLRETASADYRERTRRNVIEADGTLILARGALTGGTALTYRIARELDKPCVVVDLALTRDPAAVRRWLDRNAIRKLNVAGPRESTVPGIYAQALDFLRRLFSASAESAR